MKRARAGFVAVSVGLGSIACNALLGNSTGEVSDDADAGHVAPETDAGTPDSAALTTVDAEAALVIPTSGRDDSKPPCTTCTPVRIATLATGDSYALVADATSLYWVDRIGAHSIPKTTLSCDKDCGTLISNLVPAEFNRTGLRLTKDYLCWLTGATLECQDRHTKAVTRVSIQARDGTGSNSSDLTIIATQIFLTSTYGDGQIIRADLPGLLSGTATWDKVQSFKNDVRNFAFSSDGTAYAWGESRLLTVPRTLVRWEGTTSPETVNRDLDDEDPEAFYGDAVFARLTRIVDAGYQGAIVRHRKGEPAKEIGTGGRTQSLAVESSGVYGGTASAIHWVSLDMERTQMLIANGPSVAAVTVSDDGVYYLAARPSMNAELWKIPFE